MSIRKDEEDRYVANVAHVLTRTPEAIGQWVSHICPDCLEVPRRGDIDHITMENAGPDVIIVGCDGTWVVNPNAVGVEVPGWEDWSKPSESDARNDAYVARVKEAMQNGANVILWLTSRCPDCKRYPGRYGDAKHVGFVGHILISCTGRWVIDPNAVGLDDPTWEDWN